MQGIPMLIGYFLRSPGGKRTTMSVVMIMCLGECRGAGLAWASCSVHAVCMSWVSDQQLGQ
jgi:hypothetical protein